MLNQPSFVELPVRWLLAILLLLLISCSDDDTMTIPVFSCTDGLQNGNETGVDCGGDCEDCILQLEIPDVGYESPLKYNNYELIWSDEFDDATLHPEKWSYNTGDGCPNLCNWGNNELQYFTSEESNLFLDQGYLIINAAHETINGYQYSSSRINTKDKFEFQYGRVDIRAAMPTAKGSWIALWMLNKNYSIHSPDTWWPRGGEIDIMEYLGEAPSEILGTAHYGIDFPNNHRYNSQTYDNTTGPSFDEVFYVFSIIWEEDSIRWLVNDMEYHTITPQTTAANNQPYPFNDEFFMVFSFSVGGNLPTAPSPGDYPDQLIIDYVRVFQ